MRQQAHPGDGQAVKVGVRLNVAAHHLVHLQSSSEQASWGCWVGATPQEQPCGCKRGRCERSCAVQQQERAQSRPA